MGDEVEDLSWLINIPGTNTQHDFMTDQTQPFPETQASTEIFPDMFGNFVGSGGALSTVDASSWDPEPVSHDQLRISNVADANIDITFLESTLPLTSDTTLLPFYENSTSTENALLQDPVVMGMSCNYVLPLSHISTALYSTNADLTMLDTSICHEHQVARDDSDTKDSSACQRRSEADAAIRFPTILPKPSAHVGMLQSTSNMRGTYSKI